jgi:hypothetical protein
MSPGRGGGSDAGSDVDGAFIDVVLLADDVAGVEAEVQLEADAAGGVAAGLLDFSNREYGRWACAHLDRWQVINKVSGTGSGNLLTSTLKSFLRELCTAP